MSNDGRLPEVAYLAQGFAMCAHRNQRRKYEDAPYVVHCERVARMVAECTDDGSIIAAAMMHDVLEDTDVTAEEMRRVFGDAITALVLEVTDVSRPSDGKRAVRKGKDKDHLAKSSAGGATIKLADLIHNCISVATHDKGFAPVYLREADALLQVLKHGDKRLWEREWDTLKTARERLDKFS
jgi:(p)ppGpp synthase/HD superfamily hydrolase